MKSIKEKRIIWFFGILIFTAIIWVIVSFYNNQQQFRDLSNSVNVLENQFKKVFSSDDIITYSDLDTYVHSSQNLEKIKESISLLQNQGSANLLFAWSTEPKLENLFGIVEKYENHLQGVRSIREYVKDDYASTGEMHSKFPSIFHNVKSDLSIDTELSTIRIKMEVVAEEQQHLWHMKNKFNQEKVVTQFDEPFDSVRIKIYNSLNRSLESLDNKLSELYSALQQAESFQINQQEPIVEITSDFTGRTAAVMMIYESFQPFLQNIYQNIQLVQTGIQTFQENLLPGVSALSILNRIDPEFAESVILLGDVSNEIVHIGSDVHNLMQSIVLLREAANRYSSNSTQQNVILLQTQAEETLQNIKLMKSVLPPLHEGIQDAEHLMENIIQSISDLSNADLRNLLSEFTKGANNLLLQAGQPVKKFESNVETVIERLEQLVKFKDDYHTIIDGIISFDPVGVE
ncbi:MAG: hypothetical protein ACFCU6_01215 [Balneolaceae bacterium]